MKSIKNPSSTAPITIILTIKTNTAFTVQNCSTSLTASVPNTFRNILFSLTNYSILAVNTVALSLILNNPIPANTSYIRLNSSLSISYSYSAQTGNVPVQTPTSDGSLLIGNLSNTNLNSGNSYTIGNFIVTNSYSSKPVILTITSLFVSNKNFYLIDSSVLTFTANPSIITNSSIVIYNDSKANKYGTYNISFININSLISNSFIIIVFPT